MTLPELMMFLVPYAVGFHIVVPAVVSNLIRGTAPQCEQCAKRAFWILVISGVVGFALMIALIAVNETVKQFKKNM